MRITVVVAFSRPQNRERVLENFRRQRYRNKRLIVVENGAAVGQWWPAEVGAITTARGPSPARNAGLAWVRENGGGPVSFWDDDDYYGPGYLDEVAALLRPGSVVVKFFRYVRWDDGLHYCLAAEPAYPTCGATLSGFAEELPDWPEVKHEDMMYAPLLLARGLTIRTSGPRFFVYDRRSTAKRECETTQRVYLAALGPALKLGDVPDAAADAPGEPQGEWIPAPGWDELLGDVQRMAAR